MATETERKFLIRGEEYKSEVFRSMHLTQGYLCSTPKCSARVRISDDRGFLTLKGPSDARGLSRFEWEKEIPLSEARDLIPLCVSGLIDKTRHLVRNTDGRHVWEIDEFHGDNEGLVVAEIEISSDDDPFDRPSWLGEEVTGLRRYYNSSLSRHPFKDW